MNNNVADYKKCSNCGACYNICPTKAISVSDDGLFYKIVIDESLCIHCGKCKKVCPVNEPRNAQNTLRAYGAYCNDSDVVKSSSSGGAFYTVANYVIENGGVVFAAAFAANCQEVQFMSTDEVGLDDLMRSKYVESKVGTSFFKIQQELEKGRIVLFCGSPCQAAGLKRFLCKDYGNLYVCDFSCGGFPSHEIYKTHILDLEKKFKSKVKSVNFRKKIKGWSTQYRLSVTFENGKEYIKPADFDYYLYNFLKHTSIRDYCTDCDFADNHYSDIILADFWLYKKFKEIPENKTGLSLVIINSNQGQKLFDLVADRLTIYEVDLERASYNLKRRIYKESVLKDRERFLHNYSKHGLKKASQDVGMPTGVLLLYWKIRYKAAEIWREIK